MDRDTSIEYEAPEIIQVEELTGLLVVVDSGDRSHQGV